ncbi:DUF814 domain-containing protein [Candidatus Micrarchaeota archaeon]|nr:DUF814 domain-containing protein [Candidatus Micrarchaeota archaeon]
MKITVDLRKSVHENAAAYFEEAKKWERKAEGARKAIAAFEQKNIHAKSKPKQASSKKTKAKWFDGYHYTTTKNGFLVVAGKNAKQNDELYSKHLKDGDLFFHADVIGAPTTLVKSGGKPVPKEDQEQAAQIAASYSRAWKQEWNTVDVYAVQPSQVTKYSQGEFVGKGAFLISGKREWFRNTELKLYLSHDEEGVHVHAVHHAPKPENAVLIQPGRTPKEQAAKTLSKKWGVREEDLLGVLPGDVARI